jgi:hypothetical protein
MPFDSSILSERQPADLLTPDRQNMVPLRVPVMPNGDAGIADGPEYASCIISVHRIPIFVHLLAT